MHWTRILGLALLAAGLVMLFMGWNASESLTEELHETLTGRFTDDTRNYYLGGAVAVVVGLAITLFGARR